MPVAESSAGSADSKQKFCTYAKNSGIIGDLRRDILSRSGRLFDPQILYIAAAEHNVFVDTIRRWDNLFGIGFS